MEGSDQNDGESMSSVSVDGPTRSTDGEEAMLSITVQPIIVTPDLERALRFYTSLLGGVETRRFPDDGPVFYVGVRIGSSELGFVVDAEVAGGTVQRVLLSADVDDVDVLLPRVETLGGRVLGPANDMPWGQRVAHVQDPDGNTLNLTQSM
jgi:predicted enzyme related to lactoylglutathione lyase